MSDLPTIEAHGVKSVPDGVEVDIRQWPNSWAGESLSFALHKDVTIDVEMGETFDSTIVRAPSVFAVVVERHDEADDGPVTIST